jgi:polygalacturonase
MTHPAWERRAFLKKAGQGLASLPFLAALPITAEAKEPVKQHTKRSATPAAKMPLVKLNVRDFAATGDGKMKDTLAIQQALDRCNVLGGGEVLVATGKYLSGALVLRSDTTLRLEEGASLMGSPDIADYPMTQVRWESRWIKGYDAFIPRRVQKTLRSQREDYGQPGHQRTCGACRWLADGVHATAGRSASRSGRPRPTSRDKTSFAIPR